MKKSIKNILYSSSILFLVLTATSCKETKKETEKVQHNTFEGSWIAKDFIDNIIIDKGIKTIQNGVTEIIVPENLKDSITFINEDLEKNTYLASFKNDTLVSHLYETKTQKAVIQDGNLILLPLDKRYHSQEYVKVDSSLVKKAKETNVTVLRFLINKALSDNFYSTKSSKTKITFTEDGKVDGLANFKSYYISINGDSANTRGITAISFTTVEGSTQKLGIEFQQDKVELFDLVLLTSSDEKPSYRKGKLVYSLRIIKPKK
ncbi:hypothetical protein IUY40_10930 [Flavobacterium sp. ALJ2]|uniref:hypothetical protein n=1 Tax=Flavobacterium sp. ALJ2 TaxID=2786960 RepID=UPI0018A0696D|nr:hypothetical protein [Flavobacterium sp. ALJ2]MBF7092053.1 hypothetical protein [Flavobacterium sp. ALJ2]